MRDSAGADTYIIGQFSKESVLEAFPKTVSIVREHGYRLDKVQAGDRRGGEAQKTLDVEFFSTKPALLKRVSALRKQGFYVTEYGR